MNTPPEHCFRLLPAVSPIPCATLPPIKLYKLRQLDRPFPLPPLPPAVPLSLCRSCLHQIAECAQVVLAALVAGGEQAEWFAQCRVSCVVRLTPTEYDVRYSHYDDNTLHFRLNIVSIKPRLIRFLLWLLSPFLPRTAWPLTPVGSY